MRAIRNAFFVLMVAVVLPMVAHAEDDPYSDPFEGTTLKVETQMVLADPMHRLNRGMFKFNDALYFNLLRPATRGYAAVTPKLFRRSIRNFFQNIQEPLYFLNSLLQRNIHDAQGAFTRFLVHSTVGLGGLRDPIIKREDTARRSFDQTFSKWGWRPGVYVVWPLVGPSSFLRGTIGLIGEEAMDPLNYTSAGAAAGSSALETVNETSFQLGAYEDFKKYTVDGYASLKDIYEKKIYKRARE